MDLEGLNLGQICRTCKCVMPQMTSLFEYYENPHQTFRFDDMLVACASVQVKFGDGLPSQLCQICVNQLINAFVFKHQCENIDASLREYAKNVKVNNMKAELESVESSNNSLCEKLSLKENIQEEMQTPDSAEIETDYILFISNNQVLLTCHECSKIFTTIEGLRCHKRIHMGILYKCKHCDKEYTSLHHLQCHEQSHSRKKVYVCSKTLSRQEHLKRHSMTHLREKPFSCRTCNRKFNHIDGLQHHTPRCKEYTVYNCDVCNMLFNREDNLEVHKKMHNNQLPEFPIIKNLDDIEDHYYQIDQNTNATFSDYSDVDDNFEPKLEVTESTDEEKIKEATEFTHQDVEINMNKAALIDGNYQDNNRGKENDNSEENTASHSLKFRDSNKDQPDVNDCLEFKIEVTDSKVEEEIKEVAAFEHHDEKSNVSAAALIGGEDNDNNKIKDKDSSVEKGATVWVSEGIVEKEEVKEEQLLVNFEVEENILGDDNNVASEDSSESTDFEYIPKKRIALETKLGQSRPHKDQVTDSKVEEEIKEVAAFAHHDEESNESGAALIGGEDNDNNKIKGKDSSEEKGATVWASEGIVEKEEVKEEELLVNFEVEENILGDDNKVASEDSSESTDFEYIPKKRIALETKHTQGSE